MQSQSLPCSFFLLPPSTHCYCLPCDSSTSRSAKCYTTTQAPFDGLEFTAELQPKCNSMGARMQLASMYAIEHYISMFQTLIDKLNIGRVGEGWTFHAQAQLQYKNLHPSIPHWQVQESERPSGSLPVQPATAFQLSFSLQLPLLHFIWLPAPVFQFQYCTHYVWQNSEWKVTSQGNIQAGTF